MNSEKLALRLYQTEEQLDLISEQWGRLVNSVIIMTEPSEEILKSNNLDGLIAHLANKLGVANPLLQFEEEPTTEEVPVEEQSE